MNETKICGVYLGMHEWGSGNEVSDSDWAASIEDETLISSKVIEWGCSQISWCEINAIEETTRGRILITKMVSEGRFFFCPKICPNVLIVLKKKKNGTAKSARIFSRFV
jgi:hypothetical protein